MAARRKGVRRRKSSWRFHLLGLLALGGVVWSVAGLLSAREEAPAPLTPHPHSEEAAPPAPIQHQAAENAQEHGLPYYPLEVGRYWVYQHADPQSGAQVKIERRIERREQRPGQELFFFSDGSLVYLQEGQEGKVFEVGAQGGVNVIPLEHSAAPYVYQSQGLQIEKRIGAADTTVVAGGRSYPGCLEVVTHLRSPERRAEMSYSSYYARGVGLVGQEPWPRQQQAVLTVALQDYGVQQL